MILGKNNLTFPVNYNKEIAQMVEKYGQEIFIPRKTVFMNTEDEFDCIYYIKKGRTRHSISSEDGIEKVLYILNEGWFFGETSYILSAGHTSITSQSDIDTVLYKIEKNKVEELLNNNKAFRDEIMKESAYKTIKLRYAIENLLFTSCKDRIKQLFCSNVDINSIEENNWFNVTVKYTHYEIGVIVGSSRVTVSKLIQELCKDGFIRIINKKIQVNKNKFKEFTSKSM